MALGAIGQAIQGGLGLFGMSRANQMMNDVTRNMPSEAQLRSPFQNTQGLLDRMTNFGQYSAPAMDMATQAGNQGVQTAMMAGMGGSQANAIRNRLRNSGINQALGNAANMQMKLDSGIAGQLQGQRNMVNQIKMGQAAGLMGAGGQLLGGPEGLLRTGAAFASPFTGLLGGLFK
jgi:hypothetical protein